MRAEIFSNGISVEDGNYGFATNLDQIYDSITNNTSRKRKMNPSPFLGVERSSKFLGLPPSIDSNNLHKAGWGVIWPPKPLNSCEKEHKRIFSKLIEYRSSQMNGVAPREFYYRSSWQYDDFLWSEGREVEVGNMQPEIVPYYICIVGSPERIPWDFQQYLDGEYAVGRVWFDDVSDCTKYIQNLLAHERQEAIPYRDNSEVLFFATQHDNDVPTHNSSNKLVQPLVASIRDILPSIECNTLLGNQSGMEASKANLIKRLIGTNLDGQPKCPPSLLFTASHGLEHKRSSNSQFFQQGALLCQDWEGRFVAPSPSDFFAASDVSPSMNLHGVIGICFACYSAGSPLREDWVRPGIFQRPAKIADAAFVARLPQKMLAAGLIAFIGHVSKAWDFSFLGAKGNSEQYAPFKEVTVSILKGTRVGHATDYLNQRWMQSTVLLNKRYEDKTHNYTKAQLVSQWMARNDYRGYVLLGDPASRLRFENIYL